MYRLKILTFILLCCCIAATIAGCVTSRDTSAMNQSTAENIAKKKAEEEGINVKLYNIIFSIKDKNIWMIAFRKIGFSKVRGWPTNFSIFVESDGTAELLRGM
ncbi:MAG: hypothetical protein GY795_20150 [Desulfobacterales bacterium]|nr:hypothetical protein [Desulfobacterales bacterium]